MKRLLDKLAFFFLGFGYVFVMLNLLSSIMYQKMPLLFILGVSFGAYLFMNLMLSFKAGRIIFGVLAGLSVAAIFVLYWFAKLNFITKPVDGVVTLWEKIYYNEPFHQLDMMPFITIFVVVSSLVIALAVHILFSRTIHFFILSGITITVQLFAYVVAGKENKLVFALFCCLSILSYIRHVYEKKLRNGLATDRRIVGHLMLFSLPLAIVPILAIMLIPKSDMPIQWPWLDTKIMKAIEFFEQRFSSTNVEFFSLSTTGFNGRSNRLGGPVRPSNTVVMDVKADKRTYLRGAAYTWYENNSWAQIRNDKLNVISARENEIELAETRQGWLFIPVDEMFAGIEADDLKLLKGLSSGRYNGPLFPTYNISVHYRNMTTRSMFIPLKTLLPVLDDHGNAMKINENLHGIVISNSKLPSGANYSYDYVQPMYGDPMLKKALTYSRANLYKDSLTELYKKRNDLQAAKAIADADAAAAAAESGTAESTENAENSVGAANEEDLTSSLGIVTEDIDSLTAESKWDDADQITLNSIIVKIASLEDLYARAKDIEHDYTVVTENMPERVKALALEITKDCKNDYEKVLAIESYMKKNYEYSLNASRIPEGNDFVDYFLFDDKKGYCTYFATAMTILTRYNGIPARYVEGYVLPEEPNENGIYTVTNRHAHAWVEVYFEGFGWLTFEPTAIYEGVMDYVANLTAPTNVVDPHLQEMQELMERYANRSDIPGYTPTNVHPVTPIDFKTILTYGVMALAALFVLMFMINLLAGGIGYLLILRLKQKGRVLKTYKMMLKWLSNAGYTLKAGETPMEFGKRMDRVFDFGSSSFEKVSRIFYKVRYGDQEIQQEEAHEIQAVSKALRRQVLREMGIRRYIPLRRIILGI